MIVDVQCKERCAFCGKQMDQVSQFIRHHGECQEKRKQKSLRASREKIKETGKRRAYLSGVASAQLDSALQSTVNNSEENPSEDSGVSDRANRKRARQLVDMDAVNAPPQKRGRIVENDSDALAATPDTPLHVDSANVTATSGL